MRDRTEDRSVSFLLNKIKIDKIDSTLEISRPIYT